MKKILPIIVFIISSNYMLQAQQPFITIKDSKFFKGEKPYYYIGTNYWYGALLASEKYGDRERLHRELDLLKKNGIDNLRILVGAEGGTYDYTVKPTLQTEQGKYDAELLDGLDYLLSQMAKREMYAVLYLNNNWEWSGGMSQYLEWNGYGRIPNPNLKPNTWPEFMAYTSKFHQCKPCTDAFRNHIRYIIGRTNPYSGTAYTKDPVIMSWQVANEPRIFTIENEKAFTKWLNETVQLIDELDPNHLISTGSEGKAGSNDDIAAFERTHTNPIIDYLTMHIWPKNWGWYKADEKETLETAITNAAVYVNEHLEIAEKIGKPIVIEEFGLPRENEKLSPGSPAEYRNLFYESLFKFLSESHDSGGLLGGLNFWGFGGEGKAATESGKWNKGDVFTADPPQEPQGLNTVFSTDHKLLELISSYNTQFGN